MFKIKKVKKKKLNIKRTLVFFLILYIIIYACYYFLNKPIKHIIIHGNKLVSDVEVLRVCKLKDYPSIIKYSNKRIEKNIKSIKLINNAKVRKKWGYIIEINIEENKPLFYYNDINKIVLSNGDIVNSDNLNIIGIPIFLNEIKSDLLTEFVNNFKKLNENIIYEIESIEHYPEIIDETNVINNNRFKIIMNDGNTIIVNTKTVSVLNKYNDIYASINEKKGIINLDSNKLNNLVFIPYDEVNVESVVDE